MQLPHVIYARSQKRAPMLTEVVMLSTLMFANIEIHGSFVLAASSPHIAVFMSLTADRLLVLSKKHIRQDVEIVKALLIATEHVIIQRR